MSLRIKKNDTVMVLSGRDKGKSGKVLEVIPQKGRIMVEGINMVKRHTKANAKNQQGGIISKESTLPISRVNIFCSHCQKGVRFGIRKLEDGTRIRFCRKCGEAFT